MLELYIHGTVTSGFADLFPDTKLQMEELAEIWDENFGTAQYSIPLELPWTENNKRLLNFAERLENTASPLQSWRVDVISDGIPQFYDAVITLLEKNGTFTYSRGKSNFTISGNKGLLGNLIANKTLKNLTLGGNIFIPGGARAWATAHMGGAHPDSSYIRFVPVAIEQYIDTGRPDYDNEFLAKDTVNYVVVNSAGTAWQFGRPNPDDETLAIPSGSSGYNDYRTIPFFQVKFILKSIFTEHGYNVTGSFISSTDFDDLLLLNNYSLEVYDYAANLDLSQYIVPANHVPATLLSDFIKAACAAVNMYPAFLDGRTVELRYRENRMRQKAVIEISNNCAGEFLSQVSADQAKGFKIDYGSNSDGYLGNRVQDISQYTLAATGAKKSDLDLVDIGRDFTTADIAFVTAENMYYRVADATSTPVKWDAFSERLNAYLVGEGGNSMELPMAPLAQYVRLNDATALYERQQYVGASMKGSYAIKNQKRVTNDFGLNIFYGKMYTVDGLLQPISFSHNRDEDNNAIVPYSLSLYGDEGIYANFYPDWIAIKTKNELVRLNVRLDEKLVTRLNANDFVTAHGVQLMIYKLLADYPVSKNPVAELQAYVV